MLKIEHLTKKYGEKTAVEDLSLHILKGEIYGFIGHNGAGKTTTLKSVVGILQFEEGEIRIDGDSIQENPLACKKKIAYIPDNPYFFVKCSIFNIFHSPLILSVNLLSPYQDTHALHTLYPLSFPAHQ